MNNGGTLYYLHSDHLGSTVLTTQGSTTVSQQYCAYGRKRSGTTCPGGNSLPTGHTFTGQKLDGTGLQYVSLWESNPPTRRALLWNRENKVSTQKNGERSVRQILIGVVAIGGTIFVLFYMTCLLLGKCYLEYDSTFTDFYLCQESTREAVHVVSTGSKDLFLCGNIQGTTPRPGALFLFHDDIYVLQTSFEQLPGEFIEPLPVPEKLEAGHYRVEIGYAKELLASTEFEVIRQ